MTSVSNAIKTRGHLLLDCSGVFRILILRVPSVNRIFPLRVLTAGAISLFLNITGAIATMAPVLNTPLKSDSIKNVVDVALFSCCKHLLLNQSLLHGTYLDSKFQGSGFSLEFFFFKFLKYILSRGTSMMAIAMEVPLVLP